MSSQTTCNAKGCSTRKCLEQTFLCSNHIGVLEFDQKQAELIKSERDQLLKDKAVLEATVKTTTSERDQLLTDKADLEASVKTTTSERDQLRKDKAILEATVARLETTVAKTATKLLPKKKTSGAPTTGAPTTGAPTTGAVFSLADL